MNTGAIASEVNQEDRSIKDAESRNIDSHHRLSIFFPAFFIATHNSVRSGKLLCDTNWSLLGNEGITFQSIASIPRGTLRCS